MGEVDWVRAGLMLVPAVVAVLGVEVWVRAAREQRRRRLIRDLRSMVPRDLVLDDAGRKVVEDRLLRQSHVLALGLAVYCSVGGATAPTTPAETASFFAIGALATLLVVLTVQAAGTLASAAGLERRRGGVRAAALRRRTVTSVAGLREVLRVRMLLAAHAVLVALVVVRLVTGDVSSSLVLLGVANVLGVLAGVAQLAVVRVLTLRLHPAESSAETNAYRLEMALTLRSTQLLTHTLTVVLTWTTAVLVAGLFTSEPLVLFGVAVAGSAVILLVEVGSWAGGREPLARRSLAPELARLGVPVRMGA